ncbi:hypothetical protein LTR84_006182 [Exophiala bonariae]|uniref:Oxidoreductase n=1 Tax=Exophiala bonariae TaxID=1690606 RepID=A0AAV9N1T5_9EURO|nr:hypothetical protein LTR84_006182 [Exophiala bonariae]
MSLDNNTNNNPSSPSTQRSLNTTLSSDISKLSLPQTTEPPGPSNPPKQKVWLVFGATGHMGRSIVKAALQHGDIAIAVGQSHVDSQTSMQKWHDDSDRYLGLLCDVRIRSTVSRVLEQAMRQFRRLDIIANCTGYGVIGACEDQDEAEIRNQFETNFMGTLNIIQLSLPYFRKRQAGRYLIFSSTSGALGVPGQGPYCASKYAVEGLIESMLYEVDGFDIRSTLVEPGHLRRDDVHTMANGVKLPIFGHFKVAKPSEPYMAKDSPAGHAKRTLQWIGEHQNTSVVKAAELVWQLGHCSYPPLRLLLGTYAVESIRDRLKSVTEEIEDWKHLHFPPLEGHEEKEGDDDNEGDDDQEGEGDGDEKDGDAKDDGNDDDVDEDDQDDNDNDQDIKIIKVENSGDVEMND